MEKLEMKTKDLANENFLKLKEMFPSAVTEIVTGQDEDGNPIVERAIDKEALAQEINAAVIDGNRERYQFSWPEKRNAKALSNSATTETLRLVSDRSVSKNGMRGGTDFLSSQNIYIEGDNLTALKIFRETYLGRVKMIYIDPPYNTGNDFIYKDSFKKNSAEYKENSGQYDEEGNQLVPNPESNGRFHTNWLNMIYPRLRLAKDFLSDDGVIFISIDDNEVHNLRKVCDEVFGEENFIAEFPRVTKRGGKSTDTYSKNSDYVVVYSMKSTSSPINGIEHSDPGFNHKDEYYETRGAYKLNQTLDYNSLQYNKSMDYVLEINGKEYVPGGDKEKQYLRHQGQHGDHDWVWRWSKPLVEFGLKNDWIVVSKTGRNIYEDIFECFNSAKWEWL